MELKTVKIFNLKPHKKNPNQHPQEQIKMIYIVYLYWNDQENIRDYRYKKILDYSTVLIKKG